MRSFTPLLAILLAASCADRTASKSAGDTGAAHATVSGGSSAGGDASPGAETPAATKLADSPTVDLLANRYLVHLEGDGRLLIPLAAEGLRKYTQEYSQPWGDVVRVEGHRGRVLQSRAATLTFPWQGPAKAKATLWIFGAASGQRISAKLNGKSVGSHAVGAGWQPVKLDLEGLKDGENELVLFVARAGRAAGKKSYAVWHSLEIGGGAKEPPVLEPVAEVDAGGEKKAALTGAERLRMYVEIPEDATLVLSTGVSEGEAHLRVVATPVEGEGAVLLDETQKAGWEPRRLDLAPLGGKLVTLDLESSAPAATGWADARIALPKVDLVAGPKRFENAVLVVVDALRADRLKGYDPDTPVETPRITRETTERGAVFRTMQAASPSSPPSHSSIQTGMIPRVHGVVGDKAQLFAGTPMLSTQARDAGIAAGYYGNNSFGMGRLEKPGNWTAFHQPSHEGKGFDCEQLIPEMLGFARSQAEAKKRFVISSLPYEPHVPYRYHEGVSDRYYDGDWGPPVGKNVTGGFLGSIVSGKVKLRPRQWKQLKALYNGEVTHFDGCFTKLLDGLDEIGVSDSTAVILTADHGEGMFEHGHMGHAFGHFSELGNVPLIVFAPGLTDGGMVIPQAVSHIDITPTILDLLGVDVDGKVQGRSLVPLIRRRGRWTPRVVSLEYGRSFALRSRRWKLIVDYSQTQSLFDEKTDPTEQKDLLGKRPVPLRYLRDITGFFLAHRSEWHVSDWGDYNNHSPEFAKEFEAK